MKVIAAISMKGGAGKSTLVRQFSVIAGESGPSWIVDRDPQQTSRKWAERRSEIEPAPAQPGYLDLAGTTLPTAMRQLRDQDGTLFFDTRPEVSESVAEVARAADLVIVPVRPSLDDLEAVPDTLAMLRRLDRRAVLIVNAAKNERRANDAKAALSQWPVPVCPVAIGDRAAYLDASIAGMAVGELPGAAAKAADAELRKAWAWIVDAGGQTRG